MAFQLRLKFCSQAQNVILNGRQMLCRTKCDTERILVTFDIVKLNLLTKDIALLLLTRR